MTLSSRPRVRGPESLDNSVGYTAKTRRGPSRGGMSQTARSKPRRGRSPTAPPSAVAQGVLNGGAHGGSTACCQRRLAGRDSVRPRSSAAVPGAEQLHWRTRATTTAPRPRAVPDSREAGHRRRRPPARRGLPRSFSAPTGERELRTRNGRAWFRPASRDRSTNTNLAERLRPTSGARVPNHGPPRPRRVHRSAR